MKKIFSLLLCLVLFFALAVPAWAEQGVTYEMCITRTEKIVTSGGRQVNQPESGECNARLYNVLGLNYHDRELFDTCILSFVDGEDGMEMTAQKLVGHNAYTYTSSDPEVIFLLSGSQLLATGIGEAEIVAYDAAGAEVDRFAVTVGGGDRAKVITAICSQCGENQGSVLHLMACGHYSCKDGSTGHGTGECAIAGHYKCDGKDHGICYNCLSHLCVGEHGAGVCQHVHSWTVNWVQPYPWLPAYSIYTCTTCGAWSYGAYSPCPGQVPPPPPDPCPGQVPPPMP